jgi:D-alanine-D-alanine ligase
MSTPSAPPPLPLDGDTSELDVVLVADRRDFSNEIKLSDSYLECTEPDYLEELNGTLQQIARSVAYYEHPYQLLDRVSQHRDAVVISVWSGERSRNRRSLVPAICEAYGIRYVGADAYAQTICSDKALAKIFARRHGLAAPGSVLVEASGTDSQFRPLGALSFPAVVKPNAEGSSIGISAKNIVHGVREAEELSRELLSYYPTVLIEEFVQGREVSIVLAGNMDRIFVDDVLEVELIGADVPLSETIFGFEYKNYDPYEVRQTLARDLLPDSTRRAARALFRGLGKVEVMRIDGRVDDEGFKVIELSPDAHLGSICLVGAAFEAAGWTYPDMLRLLLLNSGRG